MYKRFSFVTSYDEISVTSTAQVMKSPGKETSPDKLMIQFVLLLSLYRLQEQYTVVSFREKFKLRISATEKCLT